MLKVGTFKQFIPANTQIDVEGQNEFVILEEGPDGKPAQMVGRSADRKCRLITRKDATLIFNTAAKGFLSVDARAVGSVHEQVSDIPYEVPDDNQAHLTLEEKLKHYLSEMASRDRDWETKNL